MLRVQIKSLIVFIFSIPNAGDIFEKYCKH